MNIGWKEAVHEADEISNTDLWKLYCKQWVPCSEVQKPYLSLSVLRWRE